MNHFKYLLLAFSVLCLIPSISYSQTEDEEEEESTDVIDFLQNGSFENGTTDGMKKPQNLDDHAYGWRSATYVKADFYSEAARPEMLRVPENQYGKQASIDGTNYAGFRAYTKDPKKQRTYIGRDLNQQMVKNKTYCIKAQVSLADLSKYAVNSVGIYVSKNRMQTGDNKSIIEPDFQIKNKLNPVIQDREGWTTICGTYTANGGEGAIIIGCFDKDEDLQIEKLKKPTGFTQPQSLDAYYYLENVEVTQISAPSQCDCGDGQIKEEIIYSPPFMKFDELTDEEKISKSTVYFAQETYRISSVAERDLKNLVKYLEENPSINLLLTGHMDLNEFDESKIKTKLADVGGKRADSIKKFFVAAGLDESRFSIKDKAASSPVSKYKTPLQLAKNRRVEFTVK